MKTFTGTARDAHSGALLLLDNGATFYIGGLTEWPEPIHARRVTVRGRLVTAKLAPDPQVDEDGAVSHGMKGTAQVLEDATWWLEGDEPPPR